MSEDRRLDEVIRVRKSPNSFVTMDKSFLEDSRLSYKAKGILAYLLSKPDNWKVIVGNLVNYSADGKASVYAGLKELKECGYYEKVPIRCHVLSEGHTENSLSDLLEYRLCGA